MNEHDRSFGIQKIFKLHEAKDYKDETLHLACSIFDRYLFQVGVTNFPYKDITLLAVTSLILAAKIEQPISPSIIMMLGHLEERDLKRVDEERVKDLEAQILTAFGFDLHIVGPLEFLERYINLLGLDKSENIFESASCILKFIRNDAKFLDFKPSQMAACALLISTNLNCNKEI